eukprot:scaffold7375_cov268-Pinguiococcus_pyrenoidosus.AAC.58
MIGLARPKLDWTPGTDAPALLAPGERRGWWPSSSARHVPWPTHPLRPSWPSRVRAPGLLSLAQSAQHAGLDLLLSTPSRTVRFPGLPKQPKVPAKESKLPSK